jgi:hypothetical protein
MTRNLIVLSDGTGNSAATPFKTNVWRLYQALDLTDGSQVAVFGDGVGTSSVRLLRVLGLAFGFGVKRNVLNLYKFLCHNYIYGDRIWAFGFSRGAFTIRVLAGLIYREGLVTFESEEELDRNALAAYRYYRKAAFRTSIPWVIIFRYLRDRSISVWSSLTGARSYKDVKKDTFDKERNIINVHFVGVWDTVVAYGLPIDELTQAVDKWVWPMRFRDDSLLPNVEHARHALSLDDERRTFFPIPWNETAENQLRSQWAEIKPDRLQQVWFPGAHADVGGGYPDDGLSYVALCWMIEQAAKQGLRFGPNLVESYAAIAAPTGRIYDSRSGFGVFWRYQPRSVEALMGAGNKPLVHSSVVTRMAYGNDGYAPISLPEDIDVLPPHGPPVAFNSAAVANALTGTAPSGSQALSYAQRLALEKRCQFLADMQRLATANGQTRADRFALVLDTVWWRRVVYFVSLTLASIAIAYPLLQQYLQIHGVTDDLIATVAGPTSWAIGLIEGFLPGYAKPWLAAIVGNPPAAVLIVAGFLVSLRFSGFLRRRIYDRARAAWNPRGQVGRMAVNRLALTGQRHALTRGLLVFAALAAGVWMLGGVKHYLLFTLFASLAGACLVSTLYRISFSAGTIDPAKPGLFLDLARKARKSTCAVRCYRYVAQSIIPAGLLILCAIFVVFLSNRTAFDLFSTSGGYCHSALNQKEETIGSSPVVFLTKNMCHATGLSLIAGREYRISMEMKNDWFDKGERTDVRGFAADSLLYYIASPLKRWWWENWFQPIARIGEVGNYEHVLRPGAPLPVVEFNVCRPPAAKKLSVWQAIMDIPKPATMKFMQTQEDCEKEKGIRPSTLLISDITADVSGELFIYVNDAVLMWPGGTDVFYRNNSGTATVTVTRILAPEVLAPKYGGN